MCLSLTPAGRCPAACSVAAQSGVLPVFFLEEDWQAFWYSGYLKSWKPCKTTLLTVVKASASTWKFSPALQPTWMGFCNFAQCQITKMGKKEGNILRGKSFWEAGAVGKINTF